MYRVQSTEPTPNVSLDALDRANDLWSLEAEYDNDSEREAHRHMQRLRDANLSRVYRVQSRQKADNGKTYWRTDTIQQRTGWRENRRKRASRAA